jgi:hypothetical protein
VFAEKYQQVSIDDEAYLVSGSEIKSFEDVANYDSE